MGTVIFINLVIVIAVCVLNLNILFPSSFWPGWKVVHSEWQYGPEPDPSESWRQNQWEQFAIIWNEWINPSLAFVSFVVYGLSKHARAKYMRAFSFFKVHPIYRCGLAGPPIPQVKNITSSSS